MVSYNIPLRNMLVLRLSSKSATIRQLEHQIQEMVNPVLDVEYPSFPMYVTIKPCSCLDWGNFETDGAGLCLSTQSFCASQEEFLKRFAGCKEIPDGLVPFPESTKHVDIFARFFAPGNLLMTSYNEHSSVKTSGGCAKNTVTTAVRIATENRDDFVELTDERNVETRKINIEGLPTVKACYKEELQRDEALIGYANVLMIKGKNKRVLLFPTFPGHRDVAPEADEDVARAKWKEALGVETVFDVPADGLFVSGGGPHCMTKQYQFGH